jgi:ribosomal protein L11 methyltransferase
VKTFLEISISAAPSQQELLIPTMVELGCDGFRQMDSSLLCYIDKSRWGEDKFETLQLQLKSLLRTISSNAVIAITEILEENWNEQWEHSLQPIEVGKRLVVKPSWTEYAARPGAIVITIDPKMSFGTGYHESTRLTLQFLEQFVNPGSTVLDVGTGTGVLAIAAIKLGARAAVGIDIDDWSITNAKENTLLNGVAKATTSPTLRFQNWSILHSTLSLPTSR